MSGILSVTNVFGQAKSVGPTSVSLGTLYGLSPPASTFPTITLEEFLGLLGLGAKGEGP